MYYIFTDGSSSKKRKSIGCSYLIFDNNKNLVFKKSIGFIDDKSRIGIAELVSVYMVLNFFFKKLTKNKDKHIVIYSDSQYVVNELTIWFENQMLKNFYNTKNKDIIICLLWILYQLKKIEYKIEFKWIKGHQNSETFESIGNNLADIEAVNCHKEGHILKYNIENFEKEIFNFNKENNILDCIKKYYLNL